MSNMGYIILAVVLLMLLVYLIKGQGDIAKNIGKLLKIIIIIALLVVIVIFVLKFLEGNNIHLPWAGSTGNLAETDTSDENVTENNTEASISEKQYEIRIRKKEVEITESLFGNVSYSAVYISEDDIKKQLDKVRDKDASVTIIDDYADYLLYKSVVDYLKELGVSDSRITQHVNGSTKQD